MVRITEIGTDLEVENFIEFCDEITHRVAPFTLV